ncbi:hypothetical protein [Methanobrevibacter sp.]|uniref:hypothetical protein n=1 Tax=Methanobrevibacter sp. TaxID=66852 RepID=UPI00388F6B77
MDTNKILVIIGYILAILFSFIGLIYGLVLYFAKGDDEYLKKHAKYIIIIAVVLMILSFVLTMIFGISMIGMGMMS